MSYHGGTDLGAASVIGHTTRCTLDEPHLGVRTEGEGIQQEKIGGEGRGVEGRREDRTGGEWRVEERTGHEGTRQEWRVMRRERNDRGK